MSQIISRRKLLAKATTFYGVLIFAKEVQAQSPLSESDPQAMALGYKNNAASVSQQRFPKYAYGQNCGSCQLFQKGSGGLGGCPLYAGKLVSESGWCSAYNRSATASFQQPKATRVMEVEKSQVEVIKPIEIETQNNGIELTKKHEALENERLSMDASKKKCTELGFKPATEGHGKCVLQLSK